MLQVASIAAHSTVQILRLTIAGALEVERLTVSSTTRVSPVEYVDVYVKLKARQAMVVDREHDLAWSSRRGPCVAFYTYTS